MFLRDNYERPFEGIRVVSKGIGHKWGFSGLLFPMWNFSLSFRGTIDEYFPVLSDDGDFFILISTNPPPEKFVTKVVEIKEMIEC